MNMTGNRYKYILQKNHHMNMKGNRYKYVLQNGYKYILQKKTSHEHDREQV